MRCLTPLFVTGRCTTWRALPSQRRAAPPLSYSRLWQQVLRGLRALNRMGVGLGDPVAIVLPPGPEMATAFLSASAGSVVLPLNPHGPEGDFAFLFEDVRPAAVIVQEETESRARAAAKRQGLLVLTLQPRRGGAAGEFDLAGVSGEGEDEPPLATPEDFALMLCTSGTTSRSKIVPLTQRQVFFAADNTRTALEIGPGDRCLDVAALFHGHGLVAGVVSSLIGGASVICPPAFDAKSFFTWLDEFTPTWYTAVPTVHQAILQEAPKHKDIVARQRLRFVRSASAFLPDSVRAELEEVFNTVVTESYGLSEALQLTNTPLDLKARKLGSLGIPGTSEVAIMDESGKLLGPGRPGEIVAPGPVVLNGYLNPSGENPSVFRDGWFRTGDVGFLDEEGHLYMTGRVKDQINRGGEKIAPQEIDAVLQSHPAVSQAMAFGMAHPSLGEEVAAAIVLRPGCSLSPEEIRRYAKGRLQEHKTPRKVFMVPAIPSNPTGKLLRRDLATRIEGLEGRSAYVAPESPLECKLTEIWQRILNVERVGLDDDFFDLGGNSLLAVRLFAEISEHLGDAMPPENDIDLRTRESLRPSILWHAATIRQLSERLKVVGPSSSDERPLLEIQRGEGLPPFVMLTGDWGGLGFYVRNLARGLEPKQPVYALMPHDITANGAPRTIETMADSFLHTLRMTQPSGPYLLGGYSHAGLVAFEMAKRLQEEGEEIALLFVVDAATPHPVLRVLN